MTRLPPEHVVPVSSGGDGPPPATSLRMLRSGYSGDSGNCKCCWIFESFVQSQYHMRVLETFVKQYCGAPPRISNATMWIMWSRLMSPIVIVVLLCSCIVLFWLCSKYCCCSIVKLRQGSGKDRQGMARKAKGLKAYTLA